MSNVEIIKKYCDTRNINLLKKIDPIYRILFQKLCIYSLKQKKANHDIAREVLNFYSLDEKGNRLGLKDRGHKKWKEKLIN